MKRASQLLGCLLVLCITPLATASVQSWEDVVTLPTYPWYDDVNPAFRAYENVIYYPYTRQDHIAKSSEMRSYRTIHLENEYLSLTCIPELGGRIHSVRIRHLDEEMFHTNAVIKPALIAMRGAWISGGIEWNPGPHGHTVTILSPVDVLVQHHNDGSASLVIGNTEKMFRTRWTVRLTLHPGRSYLDQEIRIYNPTDSIAPYYFWNCTAFPNLEGTRFIYPMTLGTDHHGREFFRWPVHEGRDMTWLKNYDTMTSVFAYECRFDFFGAYDVNRDRGIVSYANHHELPGKKAWTWGKDDFGIVSQMALSDAGPVHAQYIEVQTGPLLTQSDYGMLKPGQEIRWREFWYPAHGLGDGFEYATRDAVVNTIREDGTLILRLMATAEYSGARVRLKRNGVQVHEEAVMLGPKQAAEVWLDDMAGEAVEIIVESGAGNELLRYITPLDIPVVEPPDLTVRPAREDGRPTPDELYEEAFLLHSQTNPAAARTAYLATLEEDPLHVRALCGLGFLALDDADWEDARDYAERALERESGNGDAWYIFGVASLWLGDYEFARRAGYNAALSLSHAARGYQLAGRAEMRLGATASAMRAFDRAHQAAPLDTRARNAWLAAAVASGNTNEALVWAAAEKLADPTDYVLHAVIGFGDGDYDAFVKVINDSSGERTFTAQEAACFFMDLGLYEEAARLLEATLLHIGDDPMSRVYAAWCRHKTGENDAAQVHLIHGATLNTDFVLPARPEALPALRHAVETRHDDAAYRLLYGHVLAHFGRLDDAAGQWRAALERDNSLSIAARTLAVHASKKERDHDTAEILLRQAIKSRPDDQILYRDLARSLERLDRREEGITLIEAMPRTRDVRYDVYLWLAQAYLDEERYDDCIELLSIARFSNWEGSTRPRDIFVDALMARGKLAFETGDFAAARADFERALTYPENLEVGAFYELTDAETRYRLGRALEAQGLIEEAAAMWKIGAEQRTSEDPKAPFIRITPAQDAYVEKCRAALKELNRD